jgi:hypothetical protein
MNEMRLRMTRTLGFAARRFFCRGTSFTVRRCFVMRERGIFEGIPTQLAIEKFI